MTIQSCLVRNVIENQLLRSSEGVRVEGVKLNNFGRAGITLLAVPFAVVEAAIRAIGALFLATPAAVASFIKNDSAKAFVSFYQRQFIDALGDAVSIPLFSLVWRPTFETIETKATPVEGQGGFMARADAAKRVQASGSDENPFAV